MVKMHVLKYGYQTYQKKFTKFHTREAESIKKATLKTKRAAGLPDIDVDERAKRILTSSQLV